VRSRQIGREPKSGFELFSTRLRIAGQQQRRPEPVMQRRVIGVEREPLSELRRSGCQIALFEGLNAARLEGVAASQQSAYCVHHGIEDRRLALTALCQVSLAAGYLEEVASVRKTLDSRYDDLKNGRVTPIDGEEAFRKLREKSERSRSGG